MGDILKVRLIGNGWRYLGERWLWFEQNSGSEKEKGGIQRVFNGRFDRILRLVVDRIENRKQERK